MGLLIEGADTLRRFGDFRSRSPRDELISFWLVNFLVAGALLLVAGVTEALLSTEFRLSRMIAYGLQVALLIPWAALCARRLHDRGWSGWWLTLALPALTFSGIKEYYRLTGDFDALIAHDGSWANLAAFLLVVPVLVLLCLPGQDGANRYGPNPRHEPTGEPA